MNIYHVYQNEVRGYDTYSDFVIVANSEEEAKNIYPSQYGNEVMTLEKADDAYSWPQDAKYITAKLIGIANDSYVKIEIICSSFHAG